MMAFIKRNYYFFMSIALACFLLQACRNAKDSNGQNIDKVHLITLDPAHFHAALVQKSMYPDIDSVVHVYAPYADGLGLTEQLNYIKQYNSRQNNPTHWEEKVYTGPDFLKKMLSSKKGNVVVLAGNNMRKTEYIKKSTDVGLNVLADKPMAINTQNFDTLLQAFKDAKKEGVILYDIMTERSVMATILQRRLMHIPVVFGRLEKGSVDSPSVIMESVHRYFKQVSGKPLIRPDWFFDPKQEGDAIVDVGTHLVDLVQWICFPRTSLDYKKDININSARIWPTPITLSQFSKITKENQFPDFLRKYVKDDSVLLTHGNGDINYTIKGVHSRVTTKWTYEAPEGGGDTYYALLRGTKADLEIRQGKEESWEPVLYVWPKEKISETYRQNVKTTINEVGKRYPGISLLGATDKTGRKGWRVIVPQKYLLGHEAHFADVMKRYLQYLKEGKLPDWEIAGMMAKYYTTTKALEIAERN